MTQQRILGIYNVEDPNRLLDGDVELRLHHSCLHLRHETPGGPETVQQLHYHNWRGFQTMPNVCLGESEPNHYGETQFFERKTGEEAEILAMWNHMLRYALRIRDMDPAVRPRFDQNFYDDEYANNCRSWVKASLSTVGLDIPPQDVLSMNGMKARPLPVFGSVFSFASGPQRTLEDLYDENRKLVDALIPPWKMSKVPKLPGVEAM